MKVYVREGSRNGKPVCEEKRFTSEEMFEHMVQFHMLRDAGEKIEVSHNGNVAFGVEPTEYYVKRNDTDYMYTFEDEV